MVSDSKGKIIDLIYLDSFNEEKDICTFQTIQMNPQALNLSFDHTSSDCYFICVCHSLYCILTSIHTANAVLSGPSGGQCLPMARQLLSLVLLVYGASQQDETEVGAKNTTFGRWNAPPGLLVSTEVRQREDSHQSHWTQRCGLKSWEALTSKWSVRKFCNIYKRNKRPLPMFFFFHLNSF